MATTISDGATTVTPTLLLGYRMRRVSRNVVRAVIGSNAPAVSLRAAKLRTGTLEFLCADKPVAAALVALLSTDQELTLHDTDHPDLGFTFVTVGQGADLELDPETRRRWLVRVDVQETD